MCSDLVYSPAERLTGLNIHLVGKPLELPRVSRTHRPVTVNGFSVNGFCLPYTLLNASILQLEPLVADRQSLNIFVLPLLLCMCIAAPEPSQLTNEVAKNPMER
jgi:hypothetical protein